MHYYRVLHIIKPFKKCICNYFMKVSKAPTCFINRFCYSFEVAEDEGVDVLSGFTGVAGGLSLCP